MKAALINDLSGLGRCSLVSDIAILSAMGITACPMPTAVFSAQTAYPAYSRLDLTSELSNYTAKWQAVSARFDGILTGYFTGADEAKTVAAFIEAARQESVPEEVVSAANLGPNRAAFEADPNFDQTASISNSNSDRPLILVDPVMADNGKPYSNYSPELSDTLRELASKADLLTPNITELFLLNGKNPAPAADPQVFSTKAGQEMLISLAHALQKAGCGDVLVTGIHSGEKIGTLLIPDLKENSSLSLKTGTTQGLVHEVNDAKQPELILNQRCPQSFSGTGDVFASIVFGRVLQGHSVKDSVRLAGSFIYSAAMSASRAGASGNDGIDFEKQLYQLLPKQKD